MAWRGTLPQVEGSGRLDPQPCCSFLFLFPKRQPLRILKRPSVQKPLGTAWPQRQEWFRESPKDRKKGPDVVLSPDTVSASHLLAPRTPVPINGIPTPAFLSLLSLFCSPSSSLASPFPGAGTYGVQPKCIQAMPFPSSTRLRSLQEPAGTGGIRTSAFSFLPVQDSEVIQHKQRENNA